MQRLFSRRSCKPHFWWACRLQTWWGGLEMVIRNKATLKTCVELNTRNVVSVFFAVRTFSSTRPMLRSGHSIIYARWSSCTRNSVLESAVGHAKCTSKWPKAHFLLGVSLEILERSRWGLSLAIHIGYLAGVRQPRTVRQGNEVISYLAINMGSAGNCEIYTLER